MRHRGEPALDELPSLFSETRHVEDFAELEMKSGHLKTLLAVDDVFFFVFFRQILVLFQKLGAVYLLQFQI